MAQIKGPSSFEYYPSGAHDTGLCRRYPEVAAQTFKKGDLVYLNAGALQVCGADPAKILGIAMEDASGTTGNRVLVQVIRPGDQFKAKFAAAFVSPGDYHLKREVVKVAAGQWSIEDAGAANTSRVVLLDSLEWSADGLLESQANGAVICTFLEEDGTAVTLLQFPRGQ